MIGAIEWHQPVIEVKDIKSTITYKNGVGTIRIKPKTGIQTIRGTISIPNKTGVKMIRPWEWKVTVIEKP